MTFSHEGGATLMDWWRHPHGFDQPTASLELLGLKVKPAQPDSLALASSRDTVLRAIRTPQDTIVANISPIFSLQV